VLGLQAGMRVLEIGCGWGGFAEHASQQGIAVHGITISDAQLDFARQRLAGNALVQLEWQDYRDLHGQYDAIVSIEMFEAVGEAYWPGFLPSCGNC
jgi:cyclopropane-fatty-acyl-phospholipid synthase